MDKTIKNLINNTIELECWHIQDEDITQMDNYEEYRESLDRLIELEKTLQAKLPEECHKLIEELEDLEGEIGALRERYLFKRGVVAGLTNLKYLEEIEDSILCI